MANLENSIRNNKIRLLIAESPARDVQAIRGFLSKETDPGYIVEAITTQKLALERALEGGIDIALLDEAALRTQGPLSIKTWKEKLPDLPLVILMNPRDAGRIAEAMEKGAEDYLLRSEFDAKLLPRVIRYAIEKKRVEDRMKSLANMGLDFVSLVAHELRAPLSITKEGVNLVLDKILGKTNQKQQEVLRTARKNIDRLDQIITNMLDISRIEAGKILLKKQAVDLADLVRQVVNVFEARIREKGLAIKVITTRESIEVVADRARILQVLMTLVSNAVKFTEKGSIEIKIVDQDDETLCFVSDTGVGIAKDDLPKVFGKFQQLGWAPGGGEKGMGLELAITKAIIELHNGRIQVESRLGKGSQFLFSLPKNQLPQTKRKKVADG